MFHLIHLEPIQFSSNPPLGPIPHVDSRISDNGDPVNLILFKERDNKSPFHGSHYDPSRHSLRAMLNLGIQLQPVSYGVTDNDPNSLSAKAKRLSSQIEASASSRVFDNSESSD